MSCSLPTSRAGIRLAPLTAEDAETYRALLHANAEHLGPDYAEELDLTMDAIAASFAAPGGPPLRFGIREAGALIGRIDLVAVHPPRYGIGYWVTANRTGSGIATAAVASALDHAREALGATDAFAGVTHGNAASERVLEKNGFVRIERFERYDRFHRAIVEAGRT